MALKAQLIEANQRLAEFERVESQREAELASLPPADTEADQAWSTVHQLQAELKAARSTITRLEEQALEQTQRHHAEIKAQSTQISELKAQLHCADSSETEAAELRRKYFELQNRLKHCASQEAEEMKELRLAKNKAEAELKHNARELGLCKEQIKDQEGQLSSLSASLTLCTRQLTEHERKAADSGITTRELNSTRSRSLTIQYYTLTHYWVLLIRLAESEAEGQRRLKSLLDARY